MATRKALGARLVSLLLPLLALPALATAEAEDADASETESPAVDPRGEVLNRAGAFPPAGVVMDHTHRKGNWTFLYSYQRHTYDGLMFGTAPISVGEAAALGYTTLPTSEVAQIHTMGVMYAPLDRLTFSLTMPYLDRALETWTPDGPETLEASGIGDVKVMFLIPFVRKGLERTHVNFGMSFPTGSIRKADASGMRLPYRMQLGSGSWDALWGITYKGEGGALSWGAQFEGLYRLATNSVGYRLGTVYHASAWMAGNLSDVVSTSVRLAWTKTGNIHGEDPQLDPTKGTNPLHDNKRHGGTRLDIGPGINVLIPALGGQRLSVEALFPIYQDLDGPQLKADLTLTAAWQWIF